MHESLSFIFHSFQDWLKRAIDSWYYHTILSGNGEIIELDEAISDVFYNSMGENYV